MLQTSHLIDLRAQICMAKPFDSAVSKSKTRAHFCQNTHDNEACLDNYRDQRFEVCLLRLFGLGLLCLNLHSSWILNYGWTLFWNQPIPWVGQAGMGTRTWANNWLAGLQLFFRSHWKDTRWKCLQTMKLKPNLWMDAAFQVFESHITYNLAQGVQREHGHWSWHGNTV